MDIIQKLREVGPVQVLKYSLGFLAVVVVLLVLLSFLNTARQSLSIQGGYGGVPGAPSIGRYQEESYDMSSGLSYRNAKSSMPVPPGEVYTPGDDGEAFEVKSYAFSYESRNKQNECGNILALKSRTDVIFENSQEYDRGCSYSFKVETKSVGEIVAVLKNLNPKDVSENSYTIKRQVEDYTSQVDILKAKLASIDTTLSQAIAAYDEISVLATKAQNPESLTKIIDSKIGIIERLTNERMSINAQIENINRSKSIELDRLLYTSFSVHVYENPFIDGRRIAESWKGAVQQSLLTINEVAQKISLGILTLLAYIVQFALYAIILLVVAKLGWHFVRKFWNNSSL